MSMATCDGIRIDVSAPRRAPRLSKEQLRRRRNEDWRTDHIDGRYDPTTGRLEKRPVALIAALFGVSEQTVRNGIAEAIDVRKRINAAL